MVASHSGPSCRVASATDIGHHRQINEDALLTGQRVFAVADGLGGHQAGEVASRVAVDRLAELDRLDAITPEAIVASLHRANDDILAHAWEHPESAGLGTTIAGIAIVAISGESHLAIFHVGDSRVYRYSDGRLERATVDHSEVEDMILRGELSVDASRAASNRHVITRSLGGQRAPLVDLWVMPLMRREQFLLCSDGLTAELDDEEIERIVVAELDLDLAARQLLDRALAAGGTDNISILLVDIDAATADETRPAQTVPRESIRHGVG